MEFTDQDGFTEHYLRELEALRKDGRDFAERFPKIAGRLKLEDTGSADPHVERLMESFAFLTARVQRKLDDDYGELSDAMLEVLYPHLLRPIPSMAVVELSPDLEQNLPAAGLRVPKGTRFLSKPIRGEPLVFRSTAPATVWPIQVKHASIESPDSALLDRVPAARAVLRLGLSCLGSYEFSALRLQSLRIFLRGDERVVAELYEFLGAHSGTLEIEDANGRRVASASKIQPLGLAESEASLPYPARSAPGYRLLQEYFAFPQKFHFIGIDGLRGLAGSEATLHIPLMRDPAINTAQVSPENFSLSAVPLVNLFPMTADPITTTADATEYDVVPDTQRVNDLEVYSVESVTSVPAGGGERTAVPPFFSVSHDSRAEPTAHWHMRRRASRKKGDDGTEVALAFVDLDRSSAAIPDRTLHVEIFATNRDLPAQSTQWGKADDFRLEGVPGVSSVRCIHRPTPTQRPKLSGAENWRLVSQLSLSHLSFANVESLRELLRVYDIAGSPSTRQQIEGVRDVRSEPTTRWVRSRFGAGFCRGMRTRLVVDRERFLGASPFLFAGVLERFFGMSCAINSFSELVLETPQDHGEVYRWNPRAGEQVLL
ncbi:MAG: type VI secretion system baseplate subunit TssF [Planctomycetota bacterium]